MDEYLEKYNALIQNIKKHSKLCVSYSGGADSTLVLKAAADSLTTENVIAVVASTDFFSKAEKEDAINSAKEIGVRCFVTDIDVLHVPQMAFNEENRCYHCKMAIFTDVAKTAYYYGIKTIANGQNADEIKEYRPGNTAVSELGVVSPLVECGITKNDVMEISERLGLHTSKKPSNSCFATRFPYEVEITKEKLEKVERAESFLRSFIPGIIRFRVHGTIARIEVEKHNFDKILGKQEIIDFIKGLGFTYVTIDLEGYRSGSTDCIVK